jgi:hypothetical protein
MINVYYTPNQRLPRRICLGQLNGKMVYYTLKDKSFMIKEEHIPLIDRKPQSFKISHEDMIFNERGELEMPDPRRDYINLWRAARRSGKVPAGVKPRMDKLKEIMNVVD